MDYLAEHLKDMAPHRAILRAVECRLMGVVALEPPILDVGCGDGHFAGIAYRGRPLDVGVDVRLADLREARARPGVYRAVGAADATALPFPGGSFATVISNCVIEHVPDLEGVLHEIRRVLRPGGAFATTVPSEHFGEYLLGSTALRRLGLRGLARRYGDFFNRISYHYHVHPPEDWRRTLAAAGFEVDELRYYFSAAAHRRFDLSHYLGVPNLVSRKLTGRWVVHPAQARLFERWLRRWADEPWPEAGAYIFIRCRAAS